MPKAARVLAALQRDGWVEIYRKGSHRRLENRLEVGPLEGAA
jgi:predicted RNA binding protein YcfA (HicA-like mRNA interferase family)